MPKILTPNAYVNSIYNITSEGLKKRGIYGVILDIDNTLVATHTKNADKKIIDYINYLNKNGIYTIIVSNARKKRVEMFCKPLNIEYVYKALKPFGKGFERALKLMEARNIQRKNIAIIGDQLFTDILGGNLQGLYTILIKPIDLNEPFPIRIKRIFEKPFLYDKKFIDKF